jgi:ectoine hydroxylase-related dioxygenase (phytanoyl-CoA dioxygenase family)
MIEAYHRASYCIVGQYINRDMLRQVREECLALEARSGPEPARFGHHDPGRADFLGPSPVFVPEVDSPSQLCRMEYLAGSSSYIAITLVPLLAAACKHLLGRSVLLFKDKCNFKNPGGGPYPPHQDIAAYRHFPPTYYLTAALMLDDTTRENGCLEFAQDYLSACDGACILATPLGNFPILPHYLGGPQNGNITEEAVRQLHWTPQEASAGDVILLDAFVPHRSAANGTLHRRQILFFTFNLSTEGDHYEVYYMQKKSDPDNPIFHVSTPSLHRAQRGPTNVYDGRSDGRGSL